MITDFEQALTAWLNLRLAAPFAGCVTVATGVASPPEAAPRIEVAVTRIDPQPDDMGPGRGEVVPGSPDMRRVLRLVCAVSIVAIPATGADRRQALAAVEQIHYLLDQGQMRNGLTMADPDDQGFVVQRARVSTARVPLDGWQQGGAALSLEVQGWFWPTGIGGVTGVPIATVRVRGISHTIRVEPPQPTTIVNGTPLALTISMHATGTMVAQGSTVQSHDFGALYCILRRADGTAISGELSGGVAAPDGGRVIALEQGSLTVTYTPGPVACTEQLVLAFDNQENGEGAEVTRIPIRVREA